MLIPAEKDNILYCRILALLSHIFPRHSYAVSTGLAVSSYTLLQPNVEAL